MNKGDINKLLISKQNKINKVKKGYPAQKEGRDGDLQVRIVPNKGLFLYYKSLLNIHNNTLQTHYLYLPIITLILYQ